MPDKQWMYEVGTHDDTIRRFEIVKRTEKTVTIKGNSWSDREQRRVIRATWGTSQAFFSVDDAIAFVVNRHGDWLETARTKVNAELSWAANLPTWEIMTRAKFAEPESQG